MTRYRGWDAPNLKQQLAASVKAVKQNKYGAKRVQVDGIWFQSKREAARYGELKLMKTAGLIHGLEVHPAYDIPPASYKNLPHVCTVILDFGYYDVKRGSIQEDVKGKDNDLSRLKRKLVEAFYGIKVEIIK